MKVRILLVAVLIAAFSTKATAVISMPLSGFASSDTVITFTGVSNESPVGASFGGSGVTFSGALNGMTAGDTGFFPANGDGVIASNWFYSQGQNQGLSFTADFTTQIDRVGFWLENWSNQTMSVQLFNGLTSVGTLSFAQTSTLTAEFRGLSSTNTFNRAVFTNTSNTNGFFAIDNFTFGLSAVSAVPEPGTWLMMLLGFGAIGGAMRMRRPRHACAARLVGR